MGTPVKLYVYDLSRGLSKAFSCSLIGKQLEGIWHTAIVVFEREYFFGADGIKSCEVGGTLLELHEVLPLGETFVPYSLFKEYLQGLKESTFTSSSYDLLKHNCNHFSDEVAQFLCGVRIPKHILDLPDIIRETPIGAKILSLIETVGAAPNITPAGRRNSREDSPDFLQLNLDIEEVRAWDLQKIFQTNSRFIRCGVIGLGTVLLMLYNSLDYNLTDVSWNVNIKKRNSLALKEKRNELKEKLARKERKRRKKQKKEEKEIQRIKEAEKELERNGYLFRNLPGNQMAESEEVSQNGETGADGPEISEVTRKARDVVAEIEAEERQELEKLRNQQRDPPVTFKNPVDLKTEFNALVSLIESKLDAEEKQSLEELNQYMLKEEGSWALGDGFLNFIGRLLNDNCFDHVVRTKLLNVLACAALKDDVILLLHQDRREHILMNYAGDVEKLTTEEQQALSLFFANLFENLSSSEWLLYISEWSHNNSNLSNIRITTKVGINALLSDNLILQDRGSAIIHNMACKEVFDDVAIELTMALLQFLNNKPSEELLFRTMKSLARFCQISGSDVTQLIQMIGPEPSKFKGTSSRIDEQIEAISAKLR